MEKSEPWLVTTAYPLYDPSPFMTRHQTPEEVTGENWPQEQLAEAKREWAQKGSDMEAIFEWLIQRNGTLAALRQKTQREEKRLLTNRQKEFGEEAKERLDRAVEDLRMRLTFFIDEIVKGAPDVNG